MKKNKGFTLIELLVVIAIIGILTSVVLASLNSARSKGADAAVKSNLANIRAQAELQYNDLGCYANTGQTCSSTVPAAVAASATACTTTNTIFAQTTIAAAIAAAKTASGGLTSCTSTVGGGAWAAVVQEKTAGKAWCVDSTGVSKELSISDQTQGILDAKTAAGVCATS